MLKRPNIFFKKKTHANREKVHDVPQPVISKLGQVRGGPRDWGVSMQK